MKVVAVSIISLLLISPGYAQERILSVQQLTNKPSEYEKTEFDIIVSAPFKNPYVSSDIELDMHLTAPSGKELFLPCFYYSGDSSRSVWKARFAAQEVGDYSYFFTLSVGPKESTNSDTMQFSVAPSGKNGFLHTDGLWVLRYDSGKPFRGIGENVAWESRAFENPEWNYDYFLPKLAHDGANFFRTWMTGWNLPLEWEKVHETKRYSDTKDYYNPGGIRRMDQLVSMADSLHLHIMLTLDNGSSLRNEFWYEGIMAHPDSIDPTDFFTFTSIQQRYKDKLRYIVARWGYSTSIAAFEFFNEIDNSAYTRSPQDSVLISQTAITEWHSEMSRYLHDIDPYHHIITTSISHRDIMGLDMLPYIDLNQKHIYKHTGAIPSEIDRYTTAYNKPYVIGEFGYEWDWTLDFTKITRQLEYDYKRGLWYGLFSPTPILPMSWWWEFFDEHNMTPYFSAVRKISDAMLAAGGGTFRKVNTKSETVESFGVKCGTTVFIYMLNNSAKERETNLGIENLEKGRYTVRSFTPDNESYETLGRFSSPGSDLVLKHLRLQGKHGLVLVVTPVR